MSTASVEYIRYRLTHSSSEQFVQGYQIAAKSLKVAPECLSYELTRCADEDPHVFVLRIVWTSKEEHLNGFRKGPHFAAFFQAVRPFYDEIVEMRHYAGVGVEWSR